MSDTRSLKTIGGIIIVVGIVVLLVGVAMPANSTNTSETCIDDPTGFGQECVSGSVSTPNPIKGPTMGIGVFALIGGIGIVLLGGRDGQQQNVNHSSQTTANDSLAKKLRQRQDNQGSSNSSTATEELLPDLPDGWSQESTGSLAPPNDAEAGVYGNYIDTNDSEYRIEIIRFSSNDSAADYTYSDSDFDWTHEATVEQFFFACRLDSETDSNNCIELLTQIEELSEENIVEN